MYVKLYTVCPCNSATHLNVFPTWSWARVCVQVGTQLERVQFGTPLECVLMSALILSVPKCRTRHSTRVWIHLDSELECVQLGMHSCEFGTKLECVFPTRHSTRVCVSIRHLIVTNSSVSSAVRHSTDWLLEPGGLCIKPIGMRELIMRELINQLIKLSIHYFQVDSQLECTCPIPIQSRQTLKDGYRC